ncbi:hypothetical protein ACSBM8_12565 [Sphingomonas sp. ASY06-1R]|uniref:hypothetical protein n=1 Tax=Sphingomonas sp. ASY06-1R TaxID=3445771 RepID=UPI003FA1E6C7
MNGPTEEKRLRIGYLGGGDHLSGLADEEIAIESRGSTDLHRVRERSLDRWLRLQIPRNYLRLAGKHNFANFHILLNLITDADQNPETLAVLEKILKGYKGRLLNKPAAVAKTTRDQVARTLAGIEGLFVPRVARFVGKERVALSAIERVGVRFPAILRSTGTHSGEILGLVDSAQDALRQIVPTTTYFLTEYIDTRSPDDLYRKMRIFFIGERQIIRHLLISDQWNVHASARARFMAGRPALVMEERQCVEDGVDALPERTRQALRQIQARMNLDFFGADLALREDGELVLFEANPTMNFFPFSADPQFAALTVARDRAADAFGAMLYGHERSDAA